MARIAMAGASVGRDLVHLKQRDGFESRGQW